MTDKTMRRDFMKIVGAGFAGASFSAATALSQSRDSGRGASGSGANGALSVRTFGTTGDGVAIDSPAINKSIEAANSAGGGTVCFPAGNYPCYSIRLEEQCRALPRTGRHDPRCRLPTQRCCPRLRADMMLPSRRPRGTPTGLRPQPLAQQPIWGEDLHDLSILGPGLIWGKGLTRGAGNSDKDAFHRRRSRRRQQGHRAEELPQRSSARLLHPQGRTLRHPRHRRRQPHHRQPQDRHRPRRHGHRLLPQRARLQLQRQLALGRRHMPQEFLRAGLRPPHRKRHHHQLLRHRRLPAGTMLDGTWKKLAPDTKVPRTGRIKCGTESNGGFKNITISNCVFEAAAVWRSRPSTARCSKTSPSPTSPCASSQIRQSSFASAAACAGPTAYPSAHCAESLSAIL